MPPVLLQTAFLLILIGLGTKVGLVPMHTWLPDAHSQAPSPVCALLSGIETTAILYVILRLFPVMQAAPNSHAETWALVLGLISVGTAAFLLLQVRDYKRMFAFSTVEHMGIILAAVGLGASVAGYGAMQQIVSHSRDQVILLLRRRRRVAGGGNARNRRGARTDPQVSRRRRRARFRRTGHRRRAAAGGFPERIFDSQSRFDAKAVCGDGLLAIFIVIAFFGVMLHVNRMVFGARENGKRRADESSIPSGNNREHMPPAVQLPAGADSGRRAGARARRLHSQTAARFADAGRQPL